MSNALIVNDDTVVVKIAKALASETRWAILKILQKEQKDVSGIAKELKQTEANISAQIKILEDAGLIKSHYEPGDHVINPNNESWGIGQIQSIINNKVTVNFENVGKKVINSNEILLEKINKIE